MVGQWIQGLTDGTEDITNLLSSLVLNKISTVVSCRHQVPELLRLGSHLARSLAYTLVRMTLMAPRS